MWSIHIFEISLVLFTLSTAALCTPFVPNAPSALLNLAASASASASAPTDQLQPYTNIADLRRRHEKIEQMQSKYAVEENSDHLPSEEGMNTNEVNPGIFQKKIEKILTKLKLISEVSTIFLPNNEGTTNETNLVMNNTIELTNTEDDMEITTISSSEDKKDVEQISEPTFQKTVYRKSVDEPPIRFTLGIKETEENEEKNTLDENNPEHQKNPLGQVGIFLAEVIGSIVALAYGAAVQFNHFIEGTKEPSNA